MKLGWRPIFLFAAVILHFWLHGLLSQGKDLQSIEANLLEVVLLGGQPARPTVSVFPRPETMAGLAGEAFDDDWLDHETTNTSSMYQDSLQIFRSIFDHEVRLDSSPC